MGEGATEGEAPHGVDDKRYFLAKRESHFGGLFFPHRGLGFGNAATESSFSTPRTYGSLQFTRICVAKGGAHKSVAKWQFILGGGGMGFLG